MARKLGKGRPYDKDLFKNIDRQSRQHKHDAGSRTDRTRYGQWDNQIQPSYQVKTRKFDTSNEDDLSFLYENRPMRRTLPQEEPEPKEWELDLSVERSLGKTSDEGWQIEDEDEIEEAAKPRHTARRINAEPELDFSMANQRPPKRAEQIQEGMSAASQEEHELQWQPPKRQPARRVLTRVEPYEDDGLDTVHRRPAATNGLRKSERIHVQRTGMEAPQHPTENRKRAPREMGGPDIHREGRVRAPRQAVAPGHPRQIGSVQGTKKKGAKLTFRHELKYYINYRDYYTLRACLKGLLKSDANSDDQGSYHIRSLYFDDRNETALSEKLQGVNFRKKYRIRIYNLSDHKISFEKKIKKGQFIAKQSFPLTREEYDRILAGDYDFLLDRKEPLAREVYTEMRVKGLKPKVIVDYIREAYVYPVGNVRITFDKDLCSGVMTEGNMFGDHVPMMPMLDTGLMVLEIKFNNILPDFIKGVLNSLNSPARSAISKYVICRKYD